MHNTVQTTVAHDLCINCGICKAGCPVSAISMRINKFKEYVPYVDVNTCIKCKKCISVCPHTMENIKNEALLVSGCICPEEYGLENADYYLMYNKNNKERIKSSSGGVVTKLAMELLRLKEIDGVIHGERIFAKRGQFHYKACISTTPDELLNRAGSIYAPLSFDQILEQCDLQKKYLFIGTPCVIQAVKRLCKEIGKYKHLQLYTCALICSHNVSELYTDFLGQKNKIDANAEYAVNLRNKDDIDNPNNFKTHFYTRTRDLVKKDRFLSFFTRSWRNYFFAMNVCLYCSDLWGRYADISVKDAWDHFADDSLGKSLCVIRNKNLNKIIKNIKDLYREQISLSDIKNNELPSAVFKQKEAQNKITFSKFSTINIKNGFLKKEIISYWSKWIYVNLGYKIAYNVLKLFTPSEKRKNKKLKNNFNSKKLITVLGGYGYGNVGDEAQCNETLHLLKERYPDYQIMNLTPTPNYSFLQHPDYFHEFASRVLFFDHGNRYDCYNLTSPMKKLSFLWRSILLLFNAHNVKNDWPTWFISAKKAKMLENIKESSLLYFCGGGYLTGATLSRFWDGMLMCWISRIFKVPVVMSGQTIGCWNSKFNKWLAQKGLKKVKLITLRDNCQSINDLKEIGISGKHVYPTHDDALFCQKSPIKQIESNNYICINFHYWGMNDENRQVLLKKINKIIDFLLKNTVCDLVFIPMHDSDKESYTDFIAQYPQSQRVMCFNYDYDFRKLRRVIADSRLCITMKHHPIIFAMGENVPVISIAYSEYYVHKNLGALEQYGQESCSVNLEDADWLEKFQSIFKSIINNKTIISCIQEHKKNLKKNKEKFLCQVDAILKDE